MENVELSNRLSTGFDPLLPTRDSRLSNFHSIMEDQPKESSETPPSSPPPLSPPPPPPQERLDGGLVAWLQVLGAFCLFFTSWYGLESYRMPYLYN